MASNTGNIYRCYSAKCGHLWVERSPRYGVPCHKCQSSARELYEDVPLRFVPKQFNTVTFESISTTALKNFRITSTDIEKLVKAYQKNALLALLEKHKFVFTKVNTYSICVEFSRPDGSIVVFMLQKGRKTSDVIVCLDANDPLWLEIQEPIKADKKNRRDNPPEIATKKTYESMTDATGAEVKVGDWVCYWASKSLGFGRIKQITMEPVQSYYSHSEKELMAKIIRGKTIVPSVKTREQIMALSPEKALVLMLER